MKTIAIIQARYKSTRLQGKVLLNLGGISVLGNVIKRLQKCKQLDGIIVATSTEPEDHLIIQEAIKHGAQYFTGSHEDVLSRYYKCAKFFDIDQIVRITADCPYIMPDVVDKLIQNNFRYGATCDYASNVIQRTYPKGFDCEVFRFDELERAYNLSEEREHVTPYIIKCAANKYSLVDSEDYSHKRITLDTAEDYRDLQSYHKIIGEIYNYDECKAVMNKLISTEEYSINLELGRV